MGAFMCPKSALASAPSPSCPPRRRWQRLPRSGRAKVIIIVIIHPSPVLDVRITLEELTPIYRSLKKTFTEKGPEVLSQCLDAFDREGNGNISVHELRWL